MNQAFEIKSPVDGSVVGIREYISFDRAVGLISKARQAQKRWAARPLAERREICQQFVETFKERETDVVRTLAASIGRPVRHGPGELRGVVDRSSYMIGVAADALSSREFPDADGFKRWISREAKGVVLVIAPWNYPFLTAVNSIVPALIAGNAVVLKHATQTTLCGEIFVEAFKAAGLPEDLLQLLLLSHAAVSALIKTRSVDHVIFTGSVRGGREISAAASEVFTSVGTELGGKDPAYVRADANLERTIEELVDGAFYNSGQSCCAVERIYVDKAVFKPFVEGFVAATRKLTLGNPFLQQTTLGPMVGASAAVAVRDQIGKALAAGAKNLIERGDFAEYPRQSAYLAPAVLIDVDHRMDLMVEETFGPAIGIMPVSSDAEAVSLMNDSQYGLTASIWTSDPEAAERIDQYIETGTMYMNRCDYLDPALPWVGVKDTGFGCSLSELAYSHLTRPKSHHYRVRF